jgi:hypothetical protein
MKCRSCGLEIADKAIVCYKCGTPTADLAPVPKAPPPARGPIWLAFPLIIAIIALAVWLIPMTPADTPARWGAWAALVVTTASTVFLLRRRRRR